MWPLHSRAEPPWGEQSIITAVSIITAATTPKPAVIPSFPSSHYCGILRAVRSSWGRAPEYFYRDRWSTAVS